MIKKLPFFKQKASAIERLIFMVIVAIVSVLLVLQVSSFFAKRRDDERKSDLSALQEKVAEYEALNGEYPTNLLVAGDIAPKLCQAPGGSGNCEHPDYTYKAFSAGTEPMVTATQNCNNKKTACTGYILFTADMERTSNPYYLRSY